MATTPKNRRGLPAGQREQVGDQPAVAGLEDLQRQDDAGEQGRAEREQGDHLAHHRSVREAAAGPRRVSRATLGTPPDPPRRCPCSPASTCVVRRCPAPASSPACCRGPRPTSTRCWPPSGPLCEDVRIRGAQAVREITARLDGVDAEDFAVPAEALRAGARRVRPGAAGRARGGRSRGSGAVHADQRRTDVTTQVVPGGTVTERWLPVRRVGLYVPGGLAPLLSSVVMNVVPAQIAGVESIAVASPPQRDHGGLPDPGVLAACALLGVTEVYAVGGAQAIAMFGYGAGSCEPVDMVTGPGNVYTTAAKRLLRGLIGIDSEAGPTEVAILADDTADPVHVAADLISQAEHDPLAGAVLVTAERGARRRRPGAGARAGGGDQALRPDLDRARRHPVGHRAGRRPRRRAAGRRRLRRRAPGDPDPATPARWRCGCATPARSSSARGRRCRWATTAPGSNHVLPTGGCARHSSGLSVQSFLRGMHVVEYDREALAGVAGHIDALAGAEDLPAHAAAVRVRAGCR